MRKSHQAFFIWGLQCSDTVIAGQSSQPLTHGTDIIQMSGSVQRAFGQAGSNQVSYVAAFIGACKADGSAFLTVVHVVLPAFLATRLADFSAQRANG